MSPDPTPGNSSVLASILASVMADASEDCNRRVAAVISENLEIEVQVVEKVIELLDNDNTVPFIARYRKEVTKGLDSTKLRSIESILHQQRSVRNRAELVKKNIGAKLTQEIKKSLDEAQSLEEVEEIYAPFKKGHKGSLAERARELGLAEAAVSVLKQCHEATNLSKYVNHSVEGLRNIKDVSLGVQHILADIISKDPKTKEVLKSLSEQYPPYLKTTQKRKIDSKVDEKKYEIYKDLYKSIKEFKSHQILAINRAEQLKIFTVKVDINPIVKKNFFQMAQKHWIPHSATDENRKLLLSSLEDAYNRLMEPMIVRRARGTLKKKADKESTDVFEQNLYNLLLSPPVKGKIVLAMDPGYTHGCKMAMLGPTGSVLETAKIFPTGRNAKTKEAKETMISLIKKYSCQTIAIGNGTACRETEEFVARLIREGAFHPLDLVYCIVSESGASIYSASEEAEAELPNLDVSMRGAVSIGRRFQDPLLELVKIEPKHLGIGMYQHDIPETLLRGAVEGVLTDCVSFVGVDINAAGVNTLKRLAGLNEKKAKAIIEWRSRNKRFINREELLQCKGIGKKTYEQCVGFLRVLSCADQSDACASTSRDGDKRTSNGNDVIVIDEESDDEAEVLGKKRKSRSKKGENKKVRRSSKDKEFQHNPLDMTFIHPESYGVAERLMVLAKTEGTDIGKPKMKTAIDALLAKRSVKSLADSLGVGEPTLHLIIDGLRQPTDYDIRAAFEKPLFRKGIMLFEDLHPRTRLTGRVNNVTTFGAFVDCGVGRDGLIHESRLRNHSELSVGDIVDVSVISIDRTKGHFGLDILSVKPHLRPQLLTSTSFDRMK